ncbi:MAG: HU family DNA-binding protein [Methylococcaceae bacterium]
MSKAKKALKAKVKVKKIVKAVENEAEPDVAAEAVPAAAQETAPASEPEPLPEQAPVAAPTLATAIAAVVAAPAPAAAGKVTKDSKGKELLVRFIANRMGVSIVNAREMFDNVIAVIEEGIIMLGKVTITGFGTFKAKEVAERVGRNPMTGETINIPKSVRLSFKAGKGTKAKLIAAAGGTLAQKERAVSSQDDVKRAKAAVKKAITKKRH